MGFYTSQENTYRGKKDSVVVEKLQNKLSRLDIIGSNISIYRRKFSCLIVTNQTPQDEMARFRKKQISTGKIEHT